MALWTPDLLQFADPAPRRFRLMHDDLPLQPGVVVTPWDAEPFAVKQTAAGANMALEVSPGIAWVANSTALQGVYRVANDATMATPTFASNSSGNPRLDKVVLTVRDDIDGGATAGQKDAIIQIIQGTPTSGATWYNQTGAGTVPNHSLLLADVLVSSGAASITTSMIMDRRPWAHGHFSKRTASTAGATATFTTTTAAGVYDTLLVRRVEWGRWPDQIYARGRTTITGEALFPASAAGLGLKIGVCWSTDGGTNWTVPTRVLVNHGTVAASKPIVITQETLLNQGSSYLMGVRASLVTANATGVQVLGATGTLSPLTLVVDEMVP